MDRKYRKLPCVFDNAQHCCSIIPSSGKHMEMRSGSGLGPELGKARQGKKPCLFPMSLSLCLSPSSLWP